MLRAEEDSSYIWLAWLEDVVMKEDAVQHLFPLSKEGDEEDQLAKETHEHKKK